MPKGWFAFDVQPGPITLKAPFSLIGCLHRVAMSRDDCLYEDFESRRQRQPIADVLGIFVRSSRKVLDLGCGTGLLLELVDVKPEAWWSSSVVVEKDAKMCGKLNYTIM